MYKNNWIPYVLSIIALPIYREIFKKKKQDRGNNSKNRPFLDIHMRNVMPKFQSSRLNGMARIEKTYIQYLEIPKNICFAVMAKEMAFFLNILYRHSSGYISHKYTIAEIPLEL